MSFISRISFALIIIFILYSTYFYINKENFKNNTLRIDNKPKNWKSLPYIEKLRIYSKKIQNKDYAFYADKYKVKNFIKNLKIKDLHYANVYKTIDLDETTLDLNTLPKDCVIKSNNGWNDIIIIKDYKIKKMIMRGKTMTNDINNYNIWRQKVVIPQKGDYQDHYKFIEPVIFVEEYLGDNLNDYKFFCFNGKIKILQVDEDRFKKHTRNLYDNNYNLLSFNLGNKQNNNKINKNNNFDRMKFICSKIAPIFDFARIDLYDINNKIYFGEITLTPGACYEPFTPAKYDYIVGSYWK